ncbi:hypothetical protein FANTH_8966 [Fusarium anthophilum]|uniref:Xylanolytic transcriptional activator regulatory domain-containing protein n=1 Tax=Fusarium anthophilum TaxID=48485 RepID=A0A8H5DZQ8_9HYPO|nr:hypothetical protein FANTH_8966 [Fusarium anthophilum]
MGISHAQILTPLSSAATESIENSSHARRVTAMGTTTSEEGIGHHRETREGFYGSSSAASFLKETCGTAIPPSNHQANPQACTSQPICPFGDVDKFALPPRRLADHLVERYFERIYWIYPVFDKQAFEHGYNSLWLPSGQSACPEEYRNLGLGEDATTVAFFSSLNAIFALGCIFSNLSTAAKTKAYEVFFSRAKDKVNLELLDINDLSVVQTLLLVALVLQGTSFPDRCWNTTGLACRVAQGLGLHSLPPYNQQESRVQRIRRRTWHGCIVLDTLVSMTFGRPTMITNISTLVLPERTVHNFQSTEDIEQAKLEFQIETVRLSIILDSMLSKVYRSWQCKLPHHDQGAVSHTDINSQSMDVFAELQGKLRAFELGLPSFLSWHEPIARETIPPHEAMILAIQRNVLQSRFTYLQVMLMPMTYTHPSSMMVLEHVNRRSMVVEQSICLYRQPGTDDMPPMPIFVGYSGSKERGWGIKQMPLGLGGHLFVQLVYSQILQPTYQDAPNHHGKATRLAPTKASPVAS